MRPAGAALGNCKADSVRTAGALGARQDAGELFEIAGFIFPERLLDIVRVTLRIGDSIRILSHAFLTPMYPTNDNGLHQAHWREFEAVSLTRRPLWPAGDVDQPGATKTATRSPIRTSSTVHDGESRKRSVSKINPSHGVDSQA